MFTLKKLNLKKVILWTSIITIFNALTLYSIHYTKDKSYQKFILQDITLAKDLLENIDIKPQKENMFFINKSLSNLLKKDKNYAQLMINGFNLSNFNRGQVLFYLDQKNNLISVSFFEIPKNYCLKFIDGISNNIDSFSVNSFIYQNHYQSIPLERKKEIDSNCQTIKNTISFTKKLN